MSAEQREADRLAGRELRRLLREGAIVTVAAVHPQDGGGFAVWSSRRLEVEPTGLTFGTLRLATSRHRYGQNMAAALRSLRRIR